MIYNLKEPELWELYGLFLVMGSAEFISLNPKP